MSLKKCHECGAVVSTEAKNCVQCGAKTKKTMGIIKIFFILTFSLAIIGSMLRPDSAPPKIKTPAEIAAEEAESKRLTMTMFYAKLLKQSMKDPESFRLVSLHSTETGYSCVKYRAANSFGGMLQSAAVVTDKGKIHLEEDNNNAPFVKAWNKECTKGGNDLTAYAHNSGGFKSSSE